MTQLNLFTNLLSPVSLGDLKLPNRVVMSAMTRMRCGPDNIPSDLHVQYYTQRATSAFILTECSPISARSNAFPGAGGIYNKEQQDGWEKVVDSVHKAGGKIIMQIWHSGRTSHSSLQNGLEIWGPSAIAVRGKNGIAQADQEVPHEMTLDEIKVVVEEFKQGAIHAKNAGFDGVQLHAAHGYLIDQFLRDCSNKREDSYGGSVENRCRLALEVTDVLIGVFGSKQVGTKLSPVGRYNDMNDSDPVTLFSHLLQEMDKRGVAYAEIKDDEDVENLEGNGYPASKTQIADVYKTFRPFFKGVIVGNNNFTAEKAEEYIKNGTVDMVSFGRPYIINPDLVPRLKAGVPLETTYNYGTFYSPGKEGYSDYLPYVTQVTDTKLDVTQNVEVNVTQNVEVSVTQKVEVSVTQKVEVSVTQKVEVSVTQKVEENHFTTLLSPITLGDYKLPNRVAMSALTRNRCTTGNVPNDLHVQYYTQRATSAFILTECSPVSKRSNAFPGAAGIYNKEQEDAWKKVTDSVHKAGGKIFMQIWHSGRASHSSLQNGLEIWGPSAIAIRGKNSSSKTDQEVPHEMTQEEIKEVVEEFKQGAIHAKNAGFDGLQLHGANGYLIDQFLRDSSNKRSDSYGGSIENRCRLALEVTDVLIGVFGAQKIGVKINPTGSFNDVNDSDPVSLFSHLLQELDKRGVIFVEIVEDVDDENSEGFGYPASKTQIPDVYKTFRPFFKGLIVGNKNFTAEKAEEYIKNGTVDMVTFGRAYIINPDLVPRLKAGVALDTNYDYKTFYSGGKEGYSDYLSYDKKHQLIEEKRTSRCCEIM